MCKGNLSLIRRMNEILAPIYYLEFQSAENV